MTVRRSFGILTALAVASVAATAAVAPAQGSKPAAERVWGDGSQWEALLGVPVAEHKMVRPFYVIAPIDRGDPQSLGRWGFGPHDNVMPVPPYRHGVGVGTCVLHIVVPGPSGVPGQNIDVVDDPNLGVPLVRAADVNGDGTMEPLTSVAVVDAAVAAGLAGSFEPEPGGAPIAFVCPVHPSHA